MPTYVYEVITSDGSQGERFEIEQSMKEDALAQHPQTGEPVKRVYLPPNLTTRYSPGQTASRLSDGNLGKNGFTKYVKDKVSGKYHKTTGSGPSEINPAQLR